MALMTENRNRAPLVGVGSPPGLPAEAVRGDFALLDGDDANFHVCITSTIYDPDGTVGTAAVFVTAALS